MNPCEAVEGSGTPRKLAEGYIKNTSCIYQFETSLQTLRDWKKNKINLYKTETK